jgi:uncharacterized membrane protein YidH (DUF202 family)
VAGPDGASNERTALAWQRTALALVAGSAVTARLTFGRVGAVALVGLSLALALGGWVLRESRLRYGQQAGVVERSRPRGGMSAAALTGGIVVMSLVELAALVVGH